MLILGWRLPTRFFKALYPASLLHVSSSMGFWPSSFMFSEGLANDVALWFALGTSMPHLSLYLNNFLPNCFWIYLSGVEAFGCKRCRNLFCKVDVRIGVHLWVVATVALCVLRNICTIWYWYIIWFSLHVVNSLNLLIFRMEDLLLSLPYL